MQTACDSMTGPHATACCRLIPDDAASCFLSRCQAAFDSLSLSWTCMAQPAAQPQLDSCPFLQPGKSCVDVGCGVGGPMRTIASTSGAQVTGITINDYQVKRATYHNERVRTLWQPDSKINC